VGRPWAPQCRADLVPEVIRAPESPAMTLDLNVVVTTCWVSMSVSVKPNGSYKERRYSKQAPILVAARLGKEPKALTETCLNAGETNSPSLCGQLGSAARKEWTLTRLSREAYPGKITDLKSVVTALGLELIRS
jgi:hypothetical protein